MATHVSRILKLLKAQPLCVLTGRTVHIASPKDVKHFPLVVLGGGAGGCSVAARSCRMLGSGNVAVVEPAKYHYYQPMWTLVGAGVTNIDATANLMVDVLPEECVLFQHRVMEFDPDNNKVTLSNGDVLSYCYLVIALGLQLNYHKVNGLLEALKEDPMVCSNYWRDTVEKTWPALQNFKGGNAVFTFPNSPVKCAGAPQKIMYLADEYWRKTGVRDQANIIYKTSQSVIFSVKKYAASLSKVIQKKGIQVDFKKNLVAIDHRKKEAVFEKMEGETGDSEAQLGCSKATFSSDDAKVGELTSVKYDFIHVTPPMSAPDVLKNSTSSIVDQTGFLDVNKSTLQHVKYNNIFGLGDCTNIPTGKTAAAVASQNKILARTIKEVMKDKKPTSNYDGYTSCPLITGYSTCILAEFDYDLQPLETFPFDQSQERWFLYRMKKDVMPGIYWKGLLNGHWSGPKMARKMLHLGMSK